jgi:uncharacterized protein
MNFRQLLALVLFLVCTLTSHHTSATGNHMKKLDPSEFFNGSQLTLAQAIKGRDVQAVKRLARQTDLNTPARQDMTVLFFAYNEALDGRDPKSLDIMTELVKAGADAVNHEVPPNLGSVWGASLNRPEPEFAKALMDGGVSPDAPGQGKGSRPGLFETSNEQTFEVMKLLIARGANVNLRSSLGTSVLYQTLSGMQLDQTEYLLMKGANPSTVDRLGVSFAWALKSIGEKPGLPPATVKKINEIRDLAVSKGMKWPPNLPEVERDRMRARGEKPVVPAGKLK